MAGKKVYYPYLDLLKFICCVGIVAIHTQPHHYFPDVLKVSISSILKLNVPIFFAISTFLLALKLDGSDNEWGNIRKFVGRLAILYVVWTIIMSPDWLCVLIMKNPENWGELLLLKIMRGAPHGGWFVISLIFGTLTTYVANKILGRTTTSILFLALLAYIPLVDAEIIPDLIKVHTIDAVMDVHFSPLIALPYLQLGFMLHWSKKFRQLRKCLTEAIGGGEMLLIIIVVLSIPIFLPSSIRPVCCIITELVIIASCSLQCENLNHVKDFTTIRKMSILIFFMHFEFATCFRYLYEHGKISYEFGLREFFITLPICCLIAYAIVRLSQRYKLLRYLY